MLCLVTRNVVKLDLMMVMCQTLNLDHFLKELEPLTEVSYMLCNCRFWSIFYCTVIVVWRAWSYIFFRQMFDEHAAAVAKSSSYHVRVIRHVHRHLLTYSMAQTSMESHWQPVAATLLYGSPEAAIGKLQRAQNDEAPIVLTTNWHTDANLLLPCLHWLSVCVKLRIIYETAVLKCVWLSSLHISTRLTWLFTTPLTVPRYNTSFA